MIQPFFSVLELDLYIPKQWQSRLLRPNAIWPVYNWGADYNGLNGLWIRLKDNHYSHKRNP